MIYFCCDERRRDAITLHPTLNGIDFLEVVDSDAVVPEDRQRLLKVALIKPLGAVAIGLNNVLIAGGERIRNIKPTAITTDPASNEVEIRLDRWGDFSRYVLRLVEISGAEVDPLPGFDALLSAIEFSFKVECPSEFDCLDREPCPPEPRPAPEIDYLTKDYQGFRRLMLDRITTLIPDWTERHAADFGVSLVELLAYTADYLSYQQDAIATEAYLGTARRRVSIRRHARLVDYRIDEGAAARVWVQVRIKAGQGPVAMPKSPTLIEACPVPGTPPVNAPIRFLTRAPSIADPPKVIAPDSPEFAQAIANRVEVFELAEPEERTLFEDQNEMPFYTWGDRNCCLPKGATRATLDGDRTSLAKGDVIVLAEKAGPQTNLPADANPAHRHAVRLTDVALTDDPLFDLFDGGGLVQPHPVTNIAWDPADALPFPLCLSAQIGDEIATDLAVAYGNIVLADHGMTLLEAEELPEVPASTLSRVLAGGHDRCRDETEAEQRRSYVPPRYQPVLDRSPLTWTTRVRLQTKPGGTISDDYAPYDGTKPVSTLVTGETVALPAVALSGKDDAHGWTARPDLLASDANSEDIVVEMESDGRALIRFGDDEYGKRPNPTSAFYAHYRIGNGIRGNIGPDAITQIVTTLIGIDSATNPLPAWGGRRPETFDEIRQRAPVAFRTPQRAITAEDYAMVAERHPG
ncbi:MAG TPA: hypothetical protein VKB09_05640, partial [Thermomicrobiales bacterium]|nr:hypothetical protein [Thermomicrobiales bacterium]